MRTKILKVVGIVLGSAAGLVLAALAVYVILYYPRTAEPFEITAPDPARRVLIATQGSDFKNTLTRALCDSLRQSSVYIRGIDVGDLAEVNAEDWDRILIVNSFIIWLNKDVDRFIARAKAPEKILVFVTSGGADWLPQPESAVDALTSASRKAYIGDLVHLITDWMSGESDQKWTPDDYLLALLYAPQVDVEAACEAITFEQERYRARHPDLVDMINRAGYQYLRLKDLPSALEVFRLNVSLFPDFWNVYDSYGEALLASGDRASAIRNYRKATDLNPGSKSASDMLKKLGG
ncbi:tetratricopeptide repeat protein [Candidatus Eisenbacteria bacterium]|uniref:Tetratricopeptide repeat protein n=1 Tax=Eiseniibacteriota bacterium TaxID=2212470 RepID=A0ABV6YQ60_UNCEI